MLGAATLAAALAAPGPAQLCVESLSAVGLLDFTKDEIARAFEDAAVEHGLQVRAADGCRAPDASVKLELLRVGSGVNILVNATLLESDDTLDLEVTVAHSTASPTLEPIRAGFSEVIGRLAPRLTPHRPETAGPGPSAQLGAGDGQLVPLGPIIVGGAGVFVIGAGVGFGFNATRRNDLARSRTHLGAQKEVDRAADSQVAANILFAVGGAAVAASVVWWVLWEPQRELAVMPAATGEGAGVMVRGTF